MDGKKKHIFIYNWCQKQATIQNSKKKNPNLKIQRASLLIVVVNINLMCTLV